VSDNNEKLSVRQFFERFPDDAACLDHLMEVRYGLRHACSHCNKKRKPNEPVREWTFHRLTGRKAYSCANCGHHIYPCAGTVFQDSRTSLQLWFYAIFLFVTTRHGVSGMELHRALGVTKKCGWRMGHQIRLLMEKADGFEIMQGHVEADESYLGGVRHGESTGRGTARKTVIMGVKQRGGRMHAEVIPNAKTGSLRRVILRHVAPGSIISTDEYRSYSLLERSGYKQGKVRHSFKEYARTDDDGVRHHVNHVESFWRLFKASVRSTHISISPKYTDRYLREFTFRANHREMQNAMFDLLVGAA
jgi:transposase